MTIIGEAEIEIRPNTDGFARGAKSKGLTLGKLLGAGIALGIGDKVKDAVTSIGKLGIAYEDQLNTFGSLGPKYAAAIGQIDKASIALGNDLKLPATSAADAAGAMVELAKAGLSVKDTLDAGKGTLQLATAANLDAAQAATITANALNTFALRGDQATRVANVFANAASASSGEVADFGLGLSQAGLVAKQAGVGLEETVATLALFAQNGLKGSDAGTSLKTSILRLIAPMPKQADLMKSLGINVRDAKGNFIGMAATADVLQARLKKLSPAQRDAALNTIFGSDAIRAGSLLYASGSKEIEKYERAVSRAGGAEEVAAAKSKGLGGALRGLQSQVESGSIEAFRKVSPELEPIIRALGERAPAAIGMAIDGFTDLIGATKDFVEDFRKSEGVAGEVREELEELGRIAKEAGRIFTEILVPAGRELGEEVLPVMRVGFHAVEPVLRFIGDHPDLFKTIAKDAVIIAVALKSVALAQGALGAVAALTGRVRGGGSQGGTGGSTVPIRVFVTNPLLRVAGITGAGGGPAPGPGGPVAGRGALAATAGRAGGGAIIGATLGLTGDPTSLSSSAVSVAGGAAAGAMVGGPWGAVAGAATTAIVLGFRRGAVQAAKDRATLEAIGAIGTNGAKAIAEGVNPILVALKTQADIAAKGINTDLSVIDTKIAELRKKYDFLPKGFKQGDSGKRLLREIEQLEAARRSLQLGRVDSLQWDAALKDLADSGIAAGKAAQSVRDKAGKVDSDSPTRLANRYGDLVDKTRRASDSLRVQERNVGRVSRKSLEARDSVRALEIQMGRIKDTSATITIDMIQHFKQTNPGAANDPELRHIGATIANVTLSSVSRSLRIPAAARGAHITGSGWTLVGEDAPELLNLPKGATVAPLDRVGGDSAELLAVMRQVLRAIQQVPAGTGAATAAALNTVSSQSRLRAAGRV
jgi:TP901 family phage tail tape measure protein